MTEITLINLGKLTEPMTALIEKVSDAVGGIYKPHQVVRLAKAEAKAAIIRADTEIEISDLRRRAVHRFVNEQETYQSNIEAITQQALSHLEEDSSPQNVADDWIRNFFEKCRIVSDDDMQKLWSRVLAGEANASGRFSRKTVNLLADLDKSDAEEFTNLCRFCWMIGDVAIPLVYKGVEEEIYKRHGIFFSSLNHLEALGLVTFDRVGQIVQTELPQKYTVQYYGRSVELTFAKEADNRLQVGNVLLTRAGEQLAPVCGSEPVDGFFELVYDWWAAEDLVPKRGIKEGDQEIAVERDSGES